MPPKTAPARASAAAPTPETLDEFLAILPPLTAEPETQPGDGPQDHWEYTGEDIPITADGGALMATVFNPNTVSGCLDPDDDEQAQYDRETLWLAELLAASPDMYAVCEAAFHFADTFHLLTKDAQYREAGRLFELSSAALAKARGEGNRGDTR